MEYASRVYLKLHSLLTRFERMHRFLKDLRDKCASSEPGNPQFWAEVQKAGRKLSLISDKEAEENGGTSAISESKAEKVRLF